MSLTRFLKHRKKQHRSLARILPARDIKPARVLPIQPGGRIVQSAAEKTSVPIAKVLPREKTETLPVGKMIGADLMPEPQIYTPMAEPVAVETLIERAQRRSPVQPAQKTPEPQPVIQTPQKAEEAETDDAPFEKETWSRLQRINKMHQERIVPEKTESKPEAKFVEQPVEKKVEIPQPEVKPSQQPVITANQPVQKKPLIEEISRKPIPQPEKVNKVQTKPQSKPETSPVQTGTESKKEAVIPEIPAQQTPAVKTEPEVSMKTEVPDVQERIQTKAETEVTPEPETTFKPQDLITDFEEIAAIEKPEILEETEPEYDDAFYSAETLKLEPITKQSENKPVQKAVQTKPEVEIPDSTPEIQPLQNVWNVEKKEPQIIPSMDPEEIEEIIPASFGKETQEKLNTALEKVQSREKSDSSVELIPPRRPRTSVMKKAVQKKPVEEPMPKAEEPEENLSPVVDIDPLKEEPLLSEQDTVETEIGDLPADLWRLIGEKPPKPAADKPKSESVKPTAARSSKSRAVQKAEEPIAEKPVMEAASSRAPVMQAKPPVQMQAEESAETLMDASSDNQSETQESEANVDLLAKKVYSEIKRKLSIEWERLRRKV